VHSPVINIETSDSESVEERDLEAETTPGALEEGTRFEEFVTPMETQDEQEPQFEDADTTQVSASVDSDGISDDGSYDMDFTHLDSQIGDNDNEPLGSTNTPSTTERKLTVEVPTQTSTNDTSTPSATTTSYSNSALTSQLAHLEAALELSRKETFHSRSALQSQISSLTSELEVTKAEKTSLQQKLANFNAAMDARDEAVFELGGVEDDDVFYTGVAGEDGDGVEGKGKKRKTIEGTLAGLRLQAKQLEELNEEFLSQSLRWSGILPLK
jgi:cell division protein FtsB